MTVVCFHNPSEENGYLSNWYPCRFTVEGVDFSSMEQYMMYKKAVYFGDKAVAAKILATDDVAEIKALGRLVANYSERYWNGIRQIVVFTGLLAKFTQNDDLKAQLSATKDSVLAECAVRDTIWGIGLSMKDPDRLNIGKWKGQNLPGYVYMKGNVQIYSAGKQAADISAFPEGIAVAVGSEEDVPDICPDQTIDKVFTIENLTSFYRFKQEHSLVIYLVDSGRFKLK